jgi:hypothetical protein
MNGDGIPADTTAEDDRVQIEIFRRMSLDKRLSMVFEMTADLRRRMADGVRRRHPDYSERQVKLAVIRLCLGDELFHTVYPGVEIVP